MKKIKTALEQIVKELIADGVVCPGHYGLTDLECKRDVTLEMCNKCWNSALNPKQRRTRKPPENSGEYWVKLKCEEKPYVFYAVVVGSGIWEFWEASNEHPHYMQDIEWRSVEPVLEPPWEEEIDG